jgi:hypothetical protein
LDIQRALNSSLSIDRRIPVETREAVDRRLRFMVTGRGFVTTITDRSRVFDRIGVLGLTKRR